MKRDPALIPLSRFHRSCLFIALMAKKNAPAIKGYPTGIKEKIEIVLEFRSKLDPHFAFENELWNSTLDKNEEIRSCIILLQSQREKLLQLLDKLESSPDEESLFAFGRLFEQHVRLEERKYFQLLQAAFSPKKLKVLMDDLSTDLDASV